MDDALVIDRRVVGDDDDGIGARQLVVRKIDAAPLVSIFAKGRNMGIVIDYDGALLLEHSDYVEGWTFAHVVDVLLVRDAHYENAASVDRLLLGVERLGDSLDDERGHLAVDLTREIDEARLVVEGAHLPREIVRIERNAVSADSRSGGELHEAERLGRRGVDDFPHIYSELVADDLHLVDETDVHRPEGILEKLHELSGLGARDLDDRLET